MHRRENHHWLGQWFKEISDIAAAHPHIEFILPLHPNPNVQKYKHHLSSWVNIVHPMDHDVLIKLLTKVKLVITDSGGIQEECSFFNKKCLVARKVTERPESVGITSFMVNNPIELKDLFDKHISTYRVNTQSPYGDGHSSKKICDIFNLTNK